MPAAIAVTGLSKSFGGPRKALADVSLRIEPGEMVALIGASGSGKSTLLRHMSGLVAGDGGEADSEIVVLDRVVQRRGRIARDVRRTRSRVGFIFQQFNLVNRLSVHKNVLAGRLGRIPAWRGTLQLFSRSERLQALEALQRVGIADHAFRRASTLSGGQQQRAAIARALVQQAEIILADEPIASLDPEAARRVMELLASINREDRITVVVSLHQVAFAMRYCPRTIALRDGRVVFDGPSASLTAEMLRRLYDAEAAVLLGEVHEDDMLPPEAASTVARPPSRPRLLAAN